MLTDLDLLQVRVDGRQSAQLWSAFATRAGLTLPKVSGLTFDTLSLAVQYAMGNGGVVLADVDMFAAEIADGRLCAPFDIALDDGYGYYLTLAAEGSPRSRDCGVSKLDHRRFRGPLREPRRDARTAHGRYRRRARGDRQTVIAMTL